MYLGKTYLFKAKMHRLFLGLTKFYLGERVNHTSELVDFWDNDQIDSCHRDLYFASYPRYKTIELLAEEINARDVKGSIAELGVYKGTTSLALNVLFPCRKLYLFDTFEGFDQKQNQYDVEQGLTNTYYDLSDTSVDYVLKQMIHPENCIVRKGVFPNSATDVDERFSLVSIDVDLYEPVLDGLRFFYPKLNDGGYIILHDYNNDDLKGVKIAAKKFEEESKSPLRVVPVCDLSGSLIYCK